MKVIVLTRGDLPNRLGKKFRTGNLYSDVQLNGQESAEAIVPGQTCIHWEGLNVRMSLNFA